VNFVKGWQICMFVAVVAIGIACSDSTGSRALATSYVLFSVNGQPVPATVDMRQDGKAQQQFRVAAGSISFLIADSLEHSASTELAWVEPGREPLVSTRCDTRRLTFVRGGDQLFINAEAEWFRPGLGSYPSEVAKAVHDTVEIVGDRLISTKTMYSPVNPVFITLRYEYRPGTPARPGCVLP
jgi:hypothetical protein